MFLFFQADDGIRDLVRSRGLGDVYKRQVRDVRPSPDVEADFTYLGTNPDAYRKVYPKSTNEAADDWTDLILSLIHI